MVQSAGDVPLELEGLFDANPCHMIVMSRS
jgi:hypothetical protein